jgi:tetratricopeptide (TPR) repeat protein
MMNQEFNSFVERYQIIYEKDPSSKVFAPLAEAYRRMGLIEEAIDLAERGVKQHPNFASGRVALGKCYAQRAEYAKAVEQLEIAVDLSPENLLGHQLIAQCYSKLKKLPESLNAYKMVLFLNPLDAKAALHVKELEAKLYSNAKDSWIEEDFSMEKLSEVVKIAQGSSHSKTLAHDHETQDSKDFERELALLDSRLSRGDWPQALVQIETLSKKYPGQSELIKRKQHLEALSTTTFEIADLISPIASHEDKRKISTLEKLLEKIDGRRKA